MVDSANLKIERAAKHVAELSELFRKHRPFTFTLERNIQTGEASVGPKKNEAVIDAAAVIIGEAVFNLRSALDHAYWEIVSPLVSEEERRAIQFPFVGKKKNRKGGIKQRMAHKVSCGFVRALYRLRPYHEAGGNELLCLIDKLCNIDKHRLLIPTGNYHQITPAHLREQVPDIPTGAVHISSVNAKRTLTWNFPPPNRAMRRKYARAPIIEKELNVPVDIIISVGTGGDPRPVVPTLNQLVDVARTTVEILRASV